MFVYVIYVLVCIIKKKKKSKYCVNNSCDYENFFLSDVNISFKMYFGVIGLYFL